MKTLVYLLFASALVLFVNGEDPLCLFNSCTSPTGFYNLSCRQVCKTEGWTDGTCSVDGTTISCICSGNGYPDQLLAPVGCPTVCIATCESCGLNYDSCTPSYSANGVANGGYCNCTAPA